MNSDEERNLPSAQKTPELTNYLKSLPADSFTRSPWTSRQNSRTPVSVAEHGENDPSKSCFSTSSSDTVHPYRSPPTENFKRSGLSYASSHTSPQKCEDEDELTSSSLRKRKLTEISNPLSIRHQDDGSAAGSESVEGFENKTEEKTTDQIVLSICWCHEKLGAAFYDASTSQVYVMEDKAENAPEFWILRTLFRELNPKILLLGGKQDCRLFKVINRLREVTEETESTEEGSSNTDEGTENRTKETSKMKRDFSEVSSASEGEIPSSGTEGSAVSSDASTYSFALSIRPASEFKYDSCRRRVLLYPWPGLARHFSDFEKDAWVRSRVDLDAFAAIRALGGLLREDLVHVNEATIAFLQVFSEDVHPAASKSGKSSASKEGLSLFALLSRTASPLSPHVLRRVILRPMRNPEILKSRYDFISWATQPTNFDTIRQIQSCLKNISNVQMLFSRLQKSQLNVRDWKILYRSLFHMILLAEICAAQELSIDAFREMKESTCEDLYHATYLIQRTLDFDQAEREGRFVVRPGLDQDLDNKKRKFSSLGEVMHRVAELELVHLPPEIDSCCIIYLPHVGYLLAIPPSSLLNSYLTTSSICQGENTTITTESYEIPGLQFMFSTADMVLFKSALCSELDTELGDIQVEIANRETSVMIRLVDVLLHQSHAFVHLVSKALLIDVQVSLLAFASVSRDSGWVRPTLNTKGNYKVKEGRHPLYEVCNLTFVSNDVIGDIRNCPVSLITGPNASGKTAYIKQVGVIAYLAHLGCFVPAEEMTFRPFDAIVAVAMVTPSVTSGLSTFMVELNRLIVAVSGSTQKSLVLIDEFGSSTYDFDGASLLASIIDFWTSQAHKFNTEAEHPGEGSEPVEQPPTKNLKRIFSEEDMAKGCPLVFASTHFYKLHLYLRHQNHVRELCMDTLQEGEKVVPLYQVVEGRTKKSYALQVARSSGLPASVISRATEVQDTLTLTSLPRRWGPLDSSEEKKKCTDIVSFFLNHDLTSAPLSDLLTTLRKHLNDTCLDSSSDSVLVNSSETLLNPPPPPSSTNHSHLTPLQSQGFDNSTQINVSNKDDVKNQENGTTKQDENMSQNVTHNVEVTTIQEVLKTVTENVIDDMTSQKHDGNNVSKTIVDTIISQIPNMMLNSVSTVMGNSFNTREYLDMKGVSNARNYATESILNLYKN